MADRLDMANKVNGASGSSGIGSMDESVLSQFDGQLKAIDKSETLLINEYMNRLESEGHEVYKFGFGQSPFSPPSFVIDALKLYAHRHEYMPVQGLSALRDAATAFHNQQLGLDLSSDTCFVGPGSKQLIFNIMSAYKKADIVLVTPSWVSYEPQAKLLGHGVIRIQTTFETKWHLTADLLDRALSARSDKTVPAIMVLNYPGNPDGGTYSPEELSAIADVARRHRLIIISDEIYGFLTFSGSHTSIARFYPEGTIMTTGLSKWAGAGGWRLGLAFFPRNMGSELKETMLGIGSETYSSAAAPVQLAAVVAYSDPRILDFVKKESQILSDIGSWVADRLSEASVRVRRPEGGFYLYPDYSLLKDRLAARSIRTSDALTTHLSAELGVAMLPGIAFGEPSSVLTSRLAYVDFDGDSAMAALTDEGITDSYRDRHFGKIMRGTHKLVDWLKSV